MHISIRFNAARANLQYSPVQSNSLRRWIVPASPSATRSSSTTSRQPSQQSPNKTVNPKPSKPNPLPNHLHTASQRAPNPEDQAAKRSANPVTKTRRPPSPVSFARFKNRFRPSAASSPTTQTTARPRKTELSTQPQHRNQE